LNNISGDKMFLYTKNKYRYIYSLLLVTLVSLLLSACNTSGKEGGQYASVPVGRAYADGQEIFFTHTEASDPAIAEKLTNMMKSPVLLVTSLAEAPESMLANVYVFENGLKGKGPLGYQPDVFDKPAGKEGYSPLRQIILVKWQDESKVREIKSASDILLAAASSELSTQKTGIVVNMPFMVWQGGQR
jgi:hypothetical protein